MPRPSIIARKWTLRKVVFTLRWYHKILWISRKNWVTVSIWEEVQVMISICTTIRTMFTGLRCHTRSFRWMTNVLPSWIRSGLPRITITWFPRPTVSWLFREAPFVSIPINIRSMGRRIKRIPHWKGGLTRRGVSLPWNFYGRPWKAEIWEIR